MQCILKKAALEKTTSGTVQRYSNQQAYLEFKQTYVSTHRPTQSEMLYEIKVIFGRPDRTIGRDFGTVCRQSVCRLSVCL